MKHRVAGRKLGRTSEHRLAMLRLALKDVPNVEISTIELDRPPPSYTIETLRALVGWAQPTASSESCSPCTTPSKKIALTRPPGRRA